MGLDGQRVRLRLANISDSFALARIHCECAAELDSSFLLQLGVRWLAAYYDTMLRSPHSVVVVAVEMSTGQVIGFASGTINAEEQLRALRRRTLYLGLWSLPAVLQKPRLIGGIVQRYFITSGEAVEKVIVTKGARAEFLAWRKDFRNGGGALGLLQAWYGVVRELGVSQVLFEVDDTNVAGMRMHKMLGAVVLRTFTTVDGKVRNVMQYPDNKLRF